MHHRLVAEGLVAVFTFPLRNDDRCLGALDLYRRTAGGFDESSRVGPPKWHISGLAGTPASIAAAS